LGAHLFEFQQSGYLCDTLILAADGTVKAHSAVLAAASPVFKRVLKSSCQPQQHTVVLPAVQLVVVSVIIQFIYTGEITVPQDTCCSLKMVMDAVSDFRIKLHITVTRYLYIV